MKIAMNLIIINGPNLNLLGKRETHLYGKESMDRYVERLRKLYKDSTIGYFQSNVEGELINKIQETGYNYHGIILNPGGYTHTSVAIADAIAAVSTPVYEVHITNLFAREEERHKSLTAAHCDGFICGFGLDSYRLAIEAIRMQS